MGKTAADAFKNFRVELKETLGHETIKRLHQQQAWIDWTVFSGLCCLLFSLMYALYALPFGAVWVSCLITQAYVMQSLGFFSHDAFEHRHLGGRKLGYVCNLFCMIPYFRLPTKYHATHTRHHRFLNTSQDSAFKLFLSDIKQDRLSKIGWFTPLGVYKLMPESLGVDAEMDQKYVEPVKKEQRILWGFMLFMLLMTYLFPTFFIYGYWLPVFGILPIIGMWRELVLEHGDIDADNPLQAATFYRSSFIFKLMHGFNSGDCHLVHHVYPNIPFYNIPKALKLLRPHFFHHQIYEYRSYWSIIYYFFIKNKKRFTSWRKTESQL